MKESYPVRGGQELQDKAENGCPESQWILAELYLDGPKETVEKGFSLLEELAKSGDVFAQVKLADIYSKRKPFSLHWKEQAFYWYCCAAKKNSAKAQYELGRICEGAADYEQAASYYNLASKQGYRDAFAQADRMFIELHRIEKIREERKKKREQLNE